MYSLAEISALSNLSVSYHEQVCITSAQQMVTNIMNIILHRYLPSTWCSKDHFFFLEIIYSLRRWIARLWMRTRSGLHPTTFTYSLEKWASKAALEKLVGKFFTRSPLVNTCLTTAAWILVSYWELTSSLPPSHFELIPFRPPTGPRMHTV
jgi:hypothetical protein